MHGNAPHSGRSEPTPTSEDRRALRRELVDIASSTRDLLADDFVVGGEIAGDDTGLQARVAVQPPVGKVVSAGFELGDGEAESLAQELAAGAVLEAKHAGRGHPRGAR
ncbi:DUF5811 family protein [Natronomonas sp.]|uniref:DUF5811 family protein n=1 Tax=Natronomonas sp. TaxID=2184060 RepID=UPI002FC30A4B